MARFPLALPPGVVRNGTIYQAKGRYYDANLVRWYGGNVLGPIGGWVERTTNTVTGAPRAALAWKDNSVVTWLAIGTHSKLYACDRAGDTYDITPDGFTSGSVDATAAIGYGMGDYGVGAFGTPRPDTALVVDATQWSLDTWGEYLLGVSPDDGNIYQWELDGGTPAAAVDNAPTCKALVVTPERFVFALGTSDPRTVAWCDQEDNTTWEAGETNQAGAFPLQTGGRLMCGRNVRGGTLLLTGIDVHIANYVGGVDVYGFTKLAEGCGAVSRQCAVEYDMMCAWMSPSGFWNYNGYVQQIPCDVLDYVFRDINVTQVSKIWGVLNSQFSEIEWRYCSSTSNEIDRCVVWNYATGTWTIGRPARTCGVDRGIFTNPIMVDIDGYIYNHESGYDYGGDTPYAETGPFELGGWTGQGVTPGALASSGFNVMHCTQLVPDDASVGDVNATFYGRLNPDAEESTYGPYTLTAKTDIRFVSRVLRVRFSGVNPVNWRVGAPNLELMPGGER